MFKRFSQIAATGAVGALALTTLGAMPAHAQSARVERQGTCSAGSQWKLKLHPDGSIIETEFQVDSNRVGQKWNVAIGDNSVRVFTGTRTTTAPSGSFTVALRIPNRAGVDNVVAAAHNTVTGENCFGRASI